MPRARIYAAIVRWTAPVLLALLWVQILSGLGSFKGQALRTVTLGLLDPAGAGKLHAVWLPLAVTVLVYVHSICGLLMAVHRLRWTRPKPLWEGLVLLLGLALAVQFLWLYYA